MSKTDVVVGLQYGDCGKGKIVDYLCPSYDVVARFQGGPNAGHSVYRDGKKYVLHSIPTGILHGKKCIIGNGCVVNMDKLEEEVAVLEAQGIQILGNLYLSDKAHIIFNEYLDQEKNESRIGTTKNGIGIAYTKKMERTGTRFEEVNYMFVADTVKVIWQYINEGKNILCEGAQGFQLDIDQGDYPYVTSSNCTSGAACTGLGIPPTYITKVIGVAKGYATRVGEGPFPTLMAPDIEEYIRKVGNEFGATTGRPRKCGWLNLDQLQRAVMVNGCSEIALTKVDTLAGLKEVKALWQGQYISFDGWGSLDGANVYETLPSNLKQYMSFIEKTMNTKIKYLSLGRETDRTIVL